MDDDTNKLREVGILRDGRRQVLKVEVGPVRTGPEFSLPLYFASSKPGNSGGGLRENVNVTTGFPKDGMDLKIGFRSR